MHLHTYSPWMRCRLAGQAIYFTYFTKAMSAMTHLDISYILRDLLNVVFDLHNCSEFASGVIITPKSRSQGWHAIPESTQLFHRWPQSPSQASWLLVQSYCPIILLPLTPVDARMWKPTHLSLWYPLFGASEFPSPLGPEKCLGPACCNLSAVNLSIVSRFTWLFLQQHVVPWQIYCRLAVGFLCLPVLWKPKWLSRIQIRIGAVPMQPTWNARLWKEDWQRCRYWKCWWDFTTERQLEPAEEYEWEPSADFILLIKKGNAVWIHIIV